LNWPLVASILGNIEENRIICLRNEEIIIFFYKNRIFYRKDLKNLDKNRGALKGFREIEEGDLEFKKGSKGRRKRRNIL